MVPLVLFFWFKIALAIQGVLWFPRNYRIITAITVKNDIGILTDIALKMQIALGNRGILTFLPIHQYQLPFHLSVFNFFHQCQIVFNIYIFHYWWYFFFFLHF